LAQEQPFNSISVKQGVNSHLLQELSSVDSYDEHEIAARSESYAENAQVRFESDGTRILLSYGLVIFCEITLRRV
jgi:hypothetical protein